MSISFVNKETINTINFKHTEVLHDLSLITERRLKLEKALHLGNLYKHHVRISFVDKHNTTYKTEATVWAVTEKYVILKSHMMIPICSISEVELIA